MGTGDKLKVSSDLPGILISCIILFSLVKLYFSTNSLKLLILYFFLLYSLLSILNLRLKILCLKAASFWRAHFDFVFSWLFYIFFLAKLTIGQRKQMSFRGLVTPNLTTKLYWYSGTVCMGRGRGVVGGKPTKKKKANLKKKIEKYKWVRFLSHKLWDIVFLSFIIVFDLYLSLKC